MKQPLFPLSAFKFDKKIIEIREVVRVEKSAIIQCALVQTSSRQFIFRQEKSVKCYVYYVSFRFLFTNTQRIHIHGRPLSRIRGSVDTASDPVSRDLWFASHLDNKFFVKKPAVI